MSTVPDEDTQVGLIGSSVRSVDDQQDHSSRSQSTTRSPSKSTAPHHAEHSVEKDYTTVNELEDEGALINDEQEYNELFDNLGKFKTSISKKNALVSSSDDVADKDVTRQPTTIDDVEVSEIKTSVEKIDLDENLQKEFVVVDIPSKDHDSTADETHSIYELKNQDSEVSLEQLIDSQIASFSDFSSGLRKKAVKNKARKSRTKTRNDLHEAAAAVAVVPDSVIENDSLQQVPAGAPEGVYSPLVQSRSQSTVRSESTSKSPISISQVSPEKPHLARGDSYKGDNELRPGRTSTRKTDFYKTLNAASKDYLRSVSRSRSRVSKESSVSQFELVDEGALVHDTEFNPELDTAQNDYIDHVDLHNEVLKEESEEPEELKKEANVEKESTEESKTSSKPDEVSAPVESASTTVNQDLENTGLKETSSENKEDPLSDDSIEEKSSEEIPELSTIVSKSAKESEYLEEIADTVDHDETDLTEKRPDTKTATTQSIKDTKEPEIIPDEAHQEVEEKATEKSVDLLEDSQEPLVTSTKETTDNLSEDVVEQVPEDSIDEIKESFEEKEDDEAEATEVPVNVIRETSVDADDAKKADVQIGDDEALTSSEVAANDEENLKESIEGEELATDKKILEDEEDTKESLVEKVTEDDTLVEDQELKSNLKATKLPAVEEVVNDTVENPASTVSDNSPVTKTEESIDTKVDSLSEDVGGIKIEESPESEEDVKVNVVGEEQAKDKPSAKGLALVTENTEEEQDTETTKDADFVKESTEKKTGADDDTEIEPDNTQEAISTKGSQEGEDIKVDQDTVKSGSSNSVVDETERLINELEAEISGVVLTKGSSESTKDKALDEKNTETDESSRGNVTENQADETEKPDEVKADEVSEKETKDTIDESNITETPPKNPEIADQEDTKEGELVEVSEETTLETDTADITKSTDPVATKEVKSEEDITTAEAEKEEESTYEPTREEVIELLKDEPVYLYTSLAGGGFHMPQRTNKLAVILTANRIPFTYRDLGTDEEARNVWRRYSKGRLLPGIVRGKDDIIGNWEEIEEANEDYRVRELIYETL